MAQAVVTAMTVQTAGKNRRFRSELRDFLGFVVRPSFGPRLPGRNAGNGWWEDWFPSLSLGRLLKWAVLLWAVNLVFLGPIAVTAAGAGGATHRLDMQHIPWLSALLWAPIVEELVFRFSLRRIALAWWLLPAAVAAMLLGPKWPGILLISVVIAACWLPYLWGLPYTRRSLAWRHRVLYRRCFPWLFHVVALMFAAVHLYNFNLHQTPLWLMPLLVLPQWLTGLVLGWLRVRQGLGASILLHAMFNAGPLLVVWMVLRYLPDMAV